MKRQNIYLLLATALLSVSGCSSPEESGLESVPIELRASGEGEVETKADENRIDKEFATRIFASKRDGDYTKLAATATGDEWYADTKVTTNGSIALSGNPVYPEYGDWLYLVAVAPQPTSYTDADADAGTVGYTLDGQTDILYAKQIQGNRWDGSRFSKNTDNTVTPLEYTHQLTQLKFKAKKAGDKGLTVKVRSITVKDVTSAMTLTLKDGNAAFTGSTDLALILAGDGTEIKSTNAINLGVLLLPPLTSDKAYKVTVDTSVGKFEDLTIDFSSSGSSSSSSNSSSSNGSNGSGSASGDHFAKGHSYEVTLNISDKELDILSVTVAPWSSEEKGNLDLN
ncbi:fimbrillin family protein [uncultured Parabacteroides sp.]|uniref:fimbrillin family protein n=1 Tax=uncultured Parabacteroides sp. TaxID=512312 RepID=UPI00259B6529|nr:fimbrillin family protein [uncultured Parabacteroides sp.]